VTAKATSRAGPRRTTTARVNARARWKATGQPRAKSGLSCSGRLIRQAAATTDQDTTGQRTAVITGSVPAAASSGTIAACREWVRWKVGQATAKRMPANRTTSAGAPYCRTCGFVRKVDNGRVDR
jgi:hypothetical protein